MRVNSNIKKFFTITLFILLITIIYFVVNNNPINSTENIIPSKNPLAAGIAAGIPRFSASSIDGMSKLHIEAATITPAESPSIARRQEEPTPLPIKNTHAAPSAVPMKGINIPNKTSL